MLTLTIITLNARKYIPGSIVVGPPYSNVNPHVNGFKFKAI
jgi:hypothetical protein